MERAVQKYFKNPNTFKSEIDVWEEKPVTIGSEIASSETDGICSSSVHLLQEHIIHIVNHSQMVQFIFYSKDSPHVK